MTPLLLLLDVQRVFTEPGPLRAPHAGDALLHCRRLLTHARQKRWGVAHCLYLRSAGPFAVTAPHARPVDGFEPLAEEMVFERGTLSAYGHSDFTDLMERAHGQALVAGLSASVTFVATALDAFERGHNLLVAADALAGQRGVEAGARQHEAVARDISAQLGFLVVAAESARAGSPAGIVHATKMIEVD